MQHLIVCHQCWGKPYWDYMNWKDSKEEESVTVSFSINRSTNRKRANSQVSEYLTQNNIQWLVYNKPNWIFDSEKFKTYFPNFEKQFWLQGAFTIEPEYENPVINHSPNPDYGVFKFIISKEYVIEQLPKKIFLSHKTVDKEMVRRFKDILELLGYKTWLDDDAMPAGVSATRVIRKGFVDSCAAVFFITPNFKDKGWLRSEIDYSIAEKIKKDDRFAIITLALPDINGNIGEIPEMLQDYIFKKPKSELEALYEIIKALPLKIEEPSWKLDLMPLS